MKLLNYWIEIIENYFLSILSPPPTPNVSKVGEKYERKRWMTVPENFLKPWKNVPLCTILPVIAIQTHKQPVDGNNIQLGQGIWSFGILTKQLKFNVFCHKCWRVPQRCNLREYIPVHCA